MALVYAAIIVASSPPNTQSDLGSVAVDLLLSVPGQVHIGTYKHASNGLYIRDLPWVNVYFSLQALASNDATESVMKWHFRGYECSPNNAGENRECSEFTSAKLESNRDQMQLPSDHIPHVISRQTPLTDEERRLQFETPTNVAPPTFTTQTVYYSCAYSGGGSQWCCAQSNQGSGGPYCWNLSKCTEEYSAWNKQNIICCSASAGDCALTYQPVMPTTAPATPAPTTITTAPPATEDPFGDIPILADPTPPATSAPTTQAPTTPTPTTATPVTQAPTTPTPTTATPAPRTPTPTTEAPVTQAPTTSPPATATPATSAPATEDPFNDVPILADTPPPATSTPATQPPITPPPTTPPLTTATPGKSTPH
ncbi:Hypothetical protein PHPALM_11692 [Phytophthora palmivora]|uniref:Uncharacterized protein n=1 Tax=Phytophthora palmivora TaxID=4796 RepID=A0A2P4Y1X2_9STRA|nr:Hypothetical protein PHPALM_11692 [Phytophthora palmivora]